MRPVPSPFAPRRPVSPPRFSQDQPGSGKLPPSSTYLRPIQMGLPSQRKALFALLKEPEDAGLTGGTRSLDRRLLALNLVGTRTRLDPPRAKISGTHPTAA